MKENNNITNNQLVKYNVDQTVVKTRKQENAYSTYAAANASKQLDIHKDMDMTAGPKQRKTDTDRIVEEDEKKNDNQAQ